MRRLKGVVSVMVLALCTAGCGLDDQSITGAWYFCLDATCGALSTSGVVFKADSTYQETAQRDAAAGTYCEIPTDDARGAFNLIDTALLTQAAKAGSPEVEHTISVSGDTADLRYPNSGAWTGATFVIKRLPDTSRGPCYDAGAPKALLAPCTPPGLFHGNSPVPPAVPFLEATKECSSGFCGTTFCPGGKIVSVCIKTGAYCRFRKSDTEPVPPPDPGEPTLCTAPETCLPFADNPRCVNTEGICK
jgi:hypothetical protein